jgi:hypothetical protein
MPHIVRVIVKPDDRTGISPTRDGGKYANSSAVGALRRGTPAILNGRNRRLIIDPRLSLK